ncbi:S8 family peptidase [Kribbella sp. NPDC056861]|uniref:S8 family peptidase n=1 Tax=Kribbella sp. NPDC056861 TaxID=3154857 RepID=UPI00342963BF
MSGAVTLVTGDRVTVAGNGQVVSVVPAPSRPGAGFLTDRAKGHLTVIPTDLAGEVAAGRIDRRLFDVTALIEAGYDDARSTTIPLIVTYAGSGASGRSAVAQGKVEPIRELPAIGASALRVPKSGASTFLAGVSANQRLKAGVEKIWLDARLHPTLDQSVPQIGAPAAWQAGFTGKGVTVAVLDTGIDATHPDLADRVVDARNFTDEAAGDSFGHGTHVASTIAGTGAASAGRYRGVAPDASLLDGKVCAADGCSTSAILAGMQWAAVEKKADVINLSIGGHDTPELDPVEEAVNTLTAQTGVLFVIAAGNSGPSAGSIDSPGSADAALTVGAVDKQDELADFSGRGPRTGDGAIKPDIVAPGVDIVAAKAKDSLIGEPVGDQYLRLSGTSMATPHVAGAAALLRQQHPAWKAVQLKGVLMGSAKPLAEAGGFAQGAGRVDVAKAIKQNVLAQPTSVTFGLAQWPHTDDAPISRQLTYQNASNAPVTLSLQSILTGPGNVTAPASALTLSQSSLTIPAGGTGSVSIVSNTRHDGVDGTYTGRVTATGSDGSITTVPIAVTKEIESYDLIISHVNSTGAPAAAGVTEILNPATYDRHQVDAAEGPATLRLPKGSYFVAGAIFETPDLHYLVQPTLQLTRKTVVVVDARKTKRVTSTVAQGGAREVLVAADATLKQDGSDVLSSTATTAVGQSLFTGPLGGPAAAPYELASTITTQLAVPSANGPLVDPAITYGLVSSRQGRFFAGLHRVVKDSELAKVIAHHSSQVKDSTMSKILLGTAPGQSIGFAVPYTYALPSKTTHFLEGGGNVWWTSMTEIQPDGDGSIASLSSTESTVNAGTTYRQRWNEAVFGPSFATTHAAMRYGNSLSFALPMYSDQADHPGNSSTDAVALKLYRDGNLFAESTNERLFPADEAPTGPADFKLTASFERSTSPLSTKIDASWTFRSQQASPDGEALPLWAVRYLPTVDDHNTVERQRVSELPLLLQQQSDAKPGTITAVKVQVSGDNGKTWTKATISKTATNHYLARFVTPTGAHQLSLRTDATDSAGNTTRQTILGAYALR